MPDPITTDPITLATATADAPRPLPDGWRWARLGDVIAEAQPGFASGERDEQGILQLRMNNVDTRGNILWDREVRVPGDPQSASRYLLAPGDVLFNNTNSTELVGKSALYTGHAEPVVFSNHFTRLRPAPVALDSAYLANWLLGEWQSRTFERLCNQWVGQSAVKNDKLLALSIPLPPLAEQRRIAVILAARMAAVERARAAALVELEAAQALPAAELRAIFESEEAQAWPVVSVRAVSERIDYGYTASAVPAIREPLFLRITDIQDGGVDWHAVPGVTIASDVEKSYMLKHGDIVFARTGGTTGKSYLVVNPPRAVFASYLIRIRPAPSIDPRYLYLFFQSDGYWIQIHASARGGAQPNVNATLLGEICLPLPDLVQQQHIAAALDARMAEIARLRASLAVELDAINALPAALLRQAFNGEL